MRIKTTLLGTMIAGSLAATGLVSPASANASCVSFSGINVGSGCTSALFGVAAALGNGATADAGAFSGAFSIGTGAQAKAAGTATLAAAAGPGSLARVDGGFLNTALAAGTTGGVDYAEAQAGASNGDFANLAVSLADSSYAYAGGFDPRTPGAGNVAVNLGKGNNVQAYGFLNGALGVGGTKPYGFNGNNIVAASGILNSASSFFGDLNTVNAGTDPTAFANSAFNAFGSNNTVTAGTGPATLAGSLFTSNSTVTKSTFGVNINGIKVPNSAAATRPARAAASLRAPGNSPAPASAVAPKGNRG
jgi:hypothetical protein